MRNLEVRYARLYHGFVNSMITLEELMTVDDKVMDIIVAVV